MVGVKRVLICATATLFESFANLCIAGSKLCLTVVRSCHISIAILDGEIDRAAH